MLNLNILFQVFGPLFFSNLYNSIYSLYQLSKNVYILYIYVTVNNVILSSIALFPSHLRYLTTIMRIITSLDRLC